MREPDTDIFGAAPLCTPPDLGKIIAVRIMSFMLHGRIPQNIRRKCNLRHEATSGGISAVRLHEALLMFPECSKSLCSKLSPGRCRTKRPHKIDQHPGPLMIDPRSVHDRPLPGATALIRARFTRLGYGKTVIVAKSPGAVPDDKEPR